MPASRKSVPRGRARAQPLPAPPPRIARPRHLLAVLSRKRTLYTTRRLLEAATALGHRAVVLDTLRCNLVLERDKPAVFYNGHEVTRIGAVLPRIGASITSYGLAVVNQFEMMGVPVANSSLAISRSRDKLRALQLLASAGLDMPRTVMARDRTGLEQAVDQIGGVPAIIKLIQGTQGVGVMIAHTIEEIQTILDTFWNLGQEILLQEFIAESKGADVRALVVGDRVVGAMRRKAKAGEFRSNLHRGGQGTVVELSADYARTAVAAARVMGLEIAGVDLLESDRGPKIMEVNSSPGFEGLEAATGLDVAREIMAHVVALADAGLGGRPRGGSHREASATVPRRAGE
jgi:ribosomal protein S6--L-glutamate ligase